MGYDIHGNQLQQGCCEVHPYVQQEYPCTLCDMERNNKTAKAQKHAKEKNEYADWEAHIFKNMQHEELMHNNFKYWLIVKTMRVATMFTTWLEHKKATILKSFNS